MIHFLTFEKSKYQLGTPKGNFDWSHWCLSNKLNRNSNLIEFPETQMTEQQQVEFVDDLVNKYNDPAWREYYGGVPIKGIFSFSDTIFMAFRVAIKEGRLNHEEFKIVFVDKNNEMHQPNIDKHGKLDYWPRGFFDTYGKLLDRII